MTTETAPIPAPSRFTQITRVALLLNAALASIATTRYALGLLPHAAEQPVLARRIAAGEFAGVLIFLFVASQLRRDPWFIVPRGYSTLRANTPWRMLAV